MNVIRNASTKKSDSEELERMQEKDDADRKEDAISLHIKKENRPPLEERGRGEGGGGVRGGGGGRGVRGGGGVRVGGGGGGGKEFEALVIERRALKRDDRNVIEDRDVVERGKALLIPGRQWKVGFVNYDGKYLTAETFGFKLNATGTALKRKQKWTIEFDSSPDDDANNSAIYLRSHLGRYLAGDRRGNATCDSTDRGDAERFRVHYASDGSGRWALSNARTGYYFGGFDERIACYEKKPRRTEWWTVHLDVHPQVTLRNANRQRYASAWDDYLGVTETVPWGGRALVTLEYVEGRCAVRTFDGRCLDRNGDLVEGVSPDATYGIEIRRAGIAFRDRTGTYLSVVGRDGVILARSKSPGKDELFVVEDSQPQVCFTAHNGRMVSTRQGIDVTANQFDEEPTEKETFQLEFEGEPETDEDQGMCRIRTWDNKYWVTEDGGSGGIHATGNDPCDAGLFAIRCHSNGAISLTAMNGRYVTTRVNGSLYAGTEKLTAKEMFRFTLVNRPRLVLKCEHGFVGFHSSTCSRYECNKVTYDVIIVEYDVENPGVYYLKGHNGKYWSVDNEGRVKADQPQEPITPFVIELRGRSRMAIRTIEGKYLVGEQNGCIAAKQSDPQKATLWEY